MNPPKNSLDKSIKSGIINLIIYLTSKLDNINIPNKLKDIDIEEVIQKLNNLENTIQNDIDEFKSSFENEIIKLEENVRNRNIWMKPKLWIFHPIGKIKKMI